MSEYVVDGDLLVTSLSIEQLQKIHGELVRCKDCASFIRDATPHDDDRPHFCTELGVDLADGDGFCAWGERKKVDA